LGERLTGIGRLIERALRWVVQWWWSKTRSSWVDAWHEPYLALRLFCLVICFGGLLYFGRQAFVVSFWTGSSFVIASFLAISNATVFRIAVFRLRHPEEHTENIVPLGVAAPLLIFVGVLVSKSLRSVMQEGVVEAIGGNLLAGAIMIGAMLFLMRVSKPLTRGELPEQWDKEYEEAPTGER